MLEAEQIKIWSSKQNKKKPKSEVLHKSKQLDCWRRTGGAVEADWLKAWRLKLEAAGGAVEADWRRSKERGETERGGLAKLRFQNCKEEIRLGLRWNRKPKKYSGQNRSKRAGILAEVEQGGDLYRFAYRYEIFRQFRPERTDYTTLIKLLNH